MTGEPEGRKVDRLDDPFIAKLIQDRPSLVISSEIPYLTIELSPVQSTKLPVERVSQGHEALEPRWTQVATIADRRSKLGPMRTRHFLVPSQEANHSELVPWSRGSHRPIVSLFPVVHIVHPFYPIIR